MLDPDLLDRLAHGQEPMCPEETLGALVALHSAPNVIPPTAWLPAVLGSRILAPDAETELRALMSLYNHVGHRLEHSGMIRPPPGDSDHLRLFCAGYLEILRMDADWLRDAGESAFILRALTDESVLDDPEVELLTDSTDSREQWLDNARRELPALLEEIYVRGRGRATAQSARATSTKFSRNARCPCGSGRKRKKCCGAS